MKTSAIMMSFSVDTVKKQINVTREFAAPLKNVWQAWTDRHILDQWWAPKPWKAESKEMNFVPGGYWMYAMKGPDGSRQWCRADFTEIVELKKFVAQDAFCDEQGHIQTDFPRPVWVVNFNHLNENTVVDIQIAFENLSDLEKYLEMGFSEGFTAGLENLDETLKVINN